MVVAVGTYVTQAGTLAAITRPSAGANVTQGYVLSAITLPSHNARTTQVNLLGTTKATVDVCTTQSFVLAAVRGRVANPRLRAWTYTLDGHDFYVLRLGDTETLVYDASTEQWVNWDSFGLNFWRPNTGFDWHGGQKLAVHYGSNIVAGDDTFGLLWFLDPEQPFDEPPDSGLSTSQVPFNRVVTGQVPARGRGASPCYVIYLAGDNYATTITDFLPTLMLEYSDDAGKNYVNAGVLNGVDLDVIDPPYAWFSLGQIDNPGRLFKVTDNGVFTRIDDMKMNDD